MTSKLLMGNEAIALGAIAAGVHIVTGYPGTPSSEVLETVAANNPGDIYVEWSVNEKVALEVAAGASYAGARSLVTMKQVGLNVASDPLMSLIYIGVKGGMVILVADDPGPISSQTEQDTRHFAKYANIPVYDPSTPEEAYEMIQSAFDLSEEIGMPVLLRPTTRVCHSCSTIEVTDERKKLPIEGFIKDKRWVIFPALSYQNHKRIEENQDKIGDMLSDSSYNSIIKSGKIGIAASGVSYTYALEALSYFDEDIKLFKVGTAFPFPKKKAAKFLKGLDKVLVIEELDPVVEEGLLECTLKTGALPIIYGKKTGHVPSAGELNLEIVSKAIGQFIGKETNSLSVLSDKPDLPIRPPVLCAGCPHRASFYAVKQATKKQECVYTGDIGCYTLGNAKPLEMVDTCLCMGAGITIAQGLQRSQPGVKHIAFIGDSTFFHTGIPGIINAVYNNTDITVVVLDNSTTAMTGQQPHPGTGETMMNNISEKIDIYGMLKACGIKTVIKQNPFDLKGSIKVVQEAVAVQGPSAIIFEAPCIAVAKPEPPYTVNQDKCTKCRLCITGIGCPAIIMEGNKVLIDEPLCYGCDLCAQICPTKAIVQRKEGES